MMRKFLLAVTLLAATCCCRPDSTQPPVTRPSISESIENKSAQRVPPATLVISLDRASFGSHDPIQIHLVFNFSGKIMYQEFPAFFHESFPKVIGPSGDLLIPSQQGIGYYEGQVEGSMQVGKIEGRYTDRYDFPLTDIFDLSAKGIYRVKLERFLYGAPQDPYAGSPQLPLPDFVGDVTSNTVLFEIK